MTIPPGFFPLDLPPSGFVDANGPLYGRWEGDRFVLALRVEERHCNPAGTCHGGMLATLADMMLAMGSNIQAGLSRFLPTVSLTCDFLAPAPLGAWVEGRPEVLRITKTLVFSQGMLTVGGEPVLRANAILRLAGDPDPRFAAERYLPPAGG